MKDYQVTWKIVLSANSAEEAAELALKIQRDPNSTATYFKVKNCDSKLTTTVDLPHVSPEEWVK